MSINRITSNGYSNSICPDKRFIVPVQSDFDYIINYLGKDAYNFMVNTLEFETNSYYICNTKGKSTAGFIGRISGDRFYGVGQAGDGRNPGFPDHHGHHRDAVRRI